MNWFDKLHETFIATGHYKMILGGLRNTLIITLGALLIGVVIGSVIAIVKYFSEDAPRMKWAAALCDVYVTVIRGIPVVVLLLIFYFVVLSGADGVIVAIITFGINSGAYMAELIRSGINAVDKGQMEAACSLGFTDRKAFFDVVLPQAMPHIMPAVATV